MMSEKPTESITDVLKEFISQELAYGEDLKVEEHSDLLEKGIIDSVSLVRLVSFLEERYNIEIQDEDLIPTSFRSPRTIEALVTRYLNAPKA
jgi:acyl carrier protein